MKISVVVPVYNAAATIRACLKSLLGQNLRKEEFEIIVVDDGSADATGQIVKEYPLVRYCRQENAGPAAARNNGVRQARATIVAFIDGDCVADSEWLCSLVSLFERESTIAGVQGVYRTNQVSLTARFCQYEIEERYRRMTVLPQIDFIGTYSCAYDKKIFLDNGGFDESFPIASGEDADFSFKLARKGYILKFCPLAFVYHQHPESVGRYFRQKFYRAYWRVLLYKKHPEKMIRDSYTPQYLKAQVVMILPLLLLFCAGLLSVPMLIVFLVSLLIFFLFSGKFMYAIMNTDMIAGLLSPVYIIIRAAALAVGMLFGYFRLELIRK